MKKLIIPILILMIFTLDPKGLDGAALAEFTVDGDTLALWHMNGTAASAAKKDNAEGTAAIDLTEVNTPAADSGFDTAANGGYDIIAASDQSLTAADHANTSFPNQDFTIEFWINFDSLPDDSEVDPITKWTIGQEAFTFYLNESGVNNFELRMSIYDGSTLDTVQTTWSPIPAVDTWYYIAFVFDNTANTGWFYVDGQPMDDAHTVTANGVQDTTAVVVMGENNTGANPFDGTLDEVRISGTAHTAQNIEDYYEGVSGDERFIQQLITY